MRLPPLSPARFVQGAKFRPMITRAAVVLAAGGDGSVKKLHDIRAAVGMLGLPRADTKDPLLTAAFPGSTTYYRFNGYVVTYPSFQIKRMVLTITVNIIRLRPM